MSNNAKQKVISFAVPCYNSQAYMDKCIESLLSLGDTSRFEIIIVNDGSTDETGKIADSYAERYPDCIRVVHQENGGHGEGVNQGLKNATGFYYKVVDSDDWLDTESIKTIVARMEEQLNVEKPVDVFVSNYVYENVAEGTSRVMPLKNVFPDGKVIGWEETKKFKTSQYLSMHTLYYRTELLRKVGLKLPKHMFYVDHYVALMPLLAVERLCYLDLPTYRYFIGRADQSVNEANLIKRIDQHFAVTHAMIDAFPAEKVQGIDKKLNKYLVNYMRLLIAICSSIAQISKNKENYAKIKPLYSHLKEVNKAWYNKIRWRSILFFQMLPGPIGRFLGRAGYRVTQKVFKYN